MLLTQRRPCPRSPAGTWLNNPTSYLIQWQRSVGSDWATIPGAVGPGYLVTAADGGAALRAVDTATNEDGSAVVLHLDTSQYHGVNEVGAVIWELTELEPTFEDLVAAVRERVEDPPADIEAEVEAFVYALNERGLIDMISSKA